MLEHIHPVTVYCEYTDYNGIVHHANVLKFMEQARVGWLAAVGLSIDDLLAQDISFVIRSANLTYLKPIPAYAEIEVKTTLKQKRKICLLYEQVIRKADDADFIYCKGELLVVCTDKQFKPRPVPDWAS